MIVISSKTSTASDLAREILNQSVLPGTLAQMDPQEAARFVNEDCTWAPGWEIDATTCSSPRSYAVSNGVSSHVRVHMTKESRNSSAPAADGSYPVPYQLAWDLGVPSHALRDKDALVYWLLEKMVWCEEHEHREFARYKKEDGSWHAPLHPHRGNYGDQHVTPEWAAQYRDPGDKLIAARRPGPPHWTAFYNEFPRIRP